MDGLRPAQIGIDARYYNPGVHSQKFNADERHSNVGVDDDSLIENQVKNICQTAASGRCSESGTSCCNHGIPPRGISHDSNQLLLTLSPSALSCLQWLRLIYSKVQFASDSSSRVS